MIADRGVTDKTDLGSKRVVVARFSALGDVAMTIPALYDACLSNPETSFLFITRQRFGKMLINAPDNLKVLAPDLDHYKGVKGLWRLASEICRDFRPDMMVDLHDVMRTRLLGCFLRLKGVACHRLDKGRRERRRLTRRHGKRMLPLRPMAMRYADVFRNSGLKCLPRFRSLYKNGLPEGALNTLFSTLGMDIQNPKGDEKWLAIAPFAAHEGKVYPPEMMAKTIDILARKEGVRMWIFGYGEKESDVIEEWGCRLPGRIVNMARLNAGLEKELMLLSMCDLMLSMDSGNMHLAGLVSLPVVSVWGATHPFCGFKGRTASSEGIIQLSMTCRPCSAYGKKRCFRGDMHCLRGIPPRQIAQKCIEFL